MTQPSAAASEQMNRRYWLGYLGGDLPTMRLPTLSRPAEQTYNGRALSETLCSATGTGILSLSRFQRITEATLLLSCFLCTLNTWSRQHIAVIGMPTAGRSVVGAERIVGLFVNTVVLRIPVVSVTDLESFISAVSSHVTAAVNHDYPFEKVVDMMAPPRDLSRNPLYQVMFNMVSVPASTASMGTECTHVSPKFPPAKLDMVLSCVRDQASGEVHLSLEYNTDLFSTRMAQSMLSHTSSVIRCLAHLDPRDIRKVLCRHSL